MFKTSLSYCAAAALLSASALTPVAADARETIVAFSSALPEAELQEQVEQAIGHLLETLNPGEHARIVDATSLALISEVEMPDEAEPISPRRALQHNRKAVAQVGRFLKRAEANAEHPGAIDMPGLLRFVRTHYPAPEGGADLIVLGHPIHAPSNAPSQTMFGDRVPSDGYVAAGPDVSLYGTTRLSGSLDGYDVYFGWSASDWTVSPAHRYAVERLWSITVEAHGGSMAYQAPAEDAAGRATLFDLAGEDVPDQKHAHPLDPDAPPTMRVFKPDTGKGPETEAERPEASAKATQKATANGVEVDDFSLFASKPHPSLSGVQITTGIRYVPEDYPHRYVNAWCYFLVNRDGSQHRVSLGSKSWGQTVANADISSRARRAAGIDRDDIEAGRSACQWPTP
ncbi:hypothetical protein [Shimia sp. MMG029]|uniref:hypothetical protein n=1 Tax=Shimia sp. MMG029 TaxID=3021978 RepID=UPI0022FE1CA2|nr:hypothetical protein [Shimia sp. MMG029]MDA5556052.1 hypothetical protein [Shimia sp. MMG029]